MIKKIINGGFPLLLFLFGCSGLTVIEEKDNVNRVVRRATYTDNNISTVEEIQYHKSTTQPLQKTYKRLVGTDLVKFREEIFKYHKNSLRSVIFFYYHNNRKINTGKVNYTLKNNIVQRVIYYALSAIDSRKMFQSGIDLYTYNKNILTTRRILKFEFNKKTGRVVQRSQYVISFNNNKISSVKSSILDNKLNKIITNKEKDSKMTSEIIRNINKSLLDRSRGTNLLRN